MARTVDPGRSVGNVNRGLWWIGWRPAVSVGVGAVAGLVVGNATAIPIELLVGFHTLVTMAGAIVVGALLGLLAWYWSAQRVNARYRDVLAAFEGGTAGRDQSAITYALVGDGEGSTPLLEASRRYPATFLALDSSSVTVYEGRLDLVERTPSVDGGVEIPYDRIRAVDVAEGDLVVETTDGGRLAYPARGNPERALTALRERVRGA